MSQSATRRERGAFVSHLTSPFTARARLALVLLSPLVAGTLAVACHDLTAPTARVTPASVLAMLGDSGAPETIFLPPLGPRKRPHGILDTTLAPAVTVCRLVADTCAADTLARFSSDTTLADSLRVTLATQAYVARWRTGSLVPDTATAFRVTVTLGDTTIGAVDVKIVPDGFTPTAGDTARFALVAPRQITPIRFQIFVPADTLYVVMDGGVHGTLAAGATTIRHGANVPYRFQLDSGFTNLLVTIDDKFSSAAGRVSMTGSHVIVASADRRPGVPAADQPILTAATALARAPSAAAAQRLLNDIDALSDTTDLDQRLRQVEYTVLERQGTSVIAAIDAALDGHVLRAGQGTGDDEAQTSDGGNGEPVTAMSRLTPRAPSLVPHASLLEATKTVVTTGQLIAPEPMTIGVVNGVLTTPFGALFGANALARVARATTWGTPVPFDVRLIYNHTGSGRNVADDCTRDVAAISWAIGHNTVVQRLAACLGESTAEAAGMLADFAEAGGQLASILAHANTYRPADADSVAALTTRWRKSGRHVLLVGHSQGNLMIQQGVARLVELGRYHPATDTTCIGALSLAAPTSANWPITQRHLSGLVVESDAILLLGQNHFPQIHTELDDSASADVVLAMHRLAPALAGATLLGWRVRLHSLVDSYLRREPIRTEVQNAMAHVYHSCALGSIDISPAPLHLRPGTSATLHATLADMNGDPLDGTRGLAWSTPGGGWQQSVSLRPDGTVLGAYVGGTSVQAVTRSRLSSVGVIVDPAPLTVSATETRSGYWSPVATISGPSNISALGSGTPPTYAERPAEWGDCGAHQQFTIDGWTTDFSHTCVAHYQITTDVIANAVQYRFSVFAVGETSPRSTTTRNTGAFSFDSSGPVPSLDNPSGPAPILFDRISVIALDAGGHLLASGVTCMHGCVGWPAQ